MVDAMHFYCYGESELPLNHLLQLVHRPRWN